MQILQVLFEDLLNTCNCIYLGDRSYLEVCSGDVICLSVSYPLKEPSALRPLYTFREMHSMT